MDRIDKILDQWRSERPDLDTSAMGLFGRLRNLTLHLTREMESAFARFGLNAANFDVLATLRRSGEPYTLPPGDLIETMMVTSGTMTNRIDQLEKIGLVARTQNPSDGRSFLITLTPKGFDLIDEAVTAHVETQTRLVSLLSLEERGSLDDLLRTYLDSFEPRKGG